MRSDTTLRHDAFVLLSKKFGLVEAERFIALINAEKFDYTEYRKNIHTNESVEVVSKKAMEYRKTLKEKK